MAATARNRDRTIVARYTDQPARLPRELRDRIERAWHGEPVQLYALADLDAGLRLAQTWVALGPSRIALARGDGNGGWAVDHIERARIQEARTTPGMSCHTLRLLGAPDELPLAVLRYTLRQRRAMDKLEMVLGEAVRGRDVTPASDGDDAYADAIAGPIREAQALVAHTETAVIVRLLRYLAPYRRHVALGMGAAALITVLSLVPAYLAGYLLDEVVRPAQTGALALPDAGRLGAIALGIMALAYLVRAVCAWIRLRYMSVLGEFVARDLRSDAYEHLQRLSVAFFSRKKTGSLITRVSSDTDRLWEFLAFGVVDVSLSVIMLVGLGVVLIGLDWRLGLVMTVPVPVLCAFIWLHGRRMERFFLRAWRKWSRVTDVLSDTIPGVRVIKAFHQEEREIERFERANYGATDEFNRVHRAWTGFWPLLMLGIHAMMLAVWFLALPRLLGTGGPALSPGTFVSFLLYTTMFVAPIEVIGQMARVMNRATSSAHRIFEVLDTEPEVVDAPAPVQLTPVRGRVTFEDVTFGYDGVRMVVRGLCLDVQPGEVIGLVGPSGGGKTTIANLIARFYDPQGGVVRVDGIDLRELDTGHYRQQLGMVLQDPYLFHGAVVDNIRYGRPEATEAQVVAAARAANAHDFICRLPHGYDTVVGERGHTLSGGERQRVSIARAVLHDPRILILDEATSAVDSETEAAIEEAMNRLIPGRTVFAIAHRLSTLRRATRLFVIEQGEIAQSGTHDELMRRGGTYRRLVEIQRDVQRAV